jgi:pilus assembly protein Flp/PilA
MNDLILRFLRANTGATSIEYAIMASGIALAIIATVNGLGSTIKTSYTSVDSALK